MIYDRLTDDELHYEIALRELKMKQMGEWAPAMDRYESELEALREEDRRRHSIFRNGTFKGGV